MQAVTMETFPITAFPSLMTWTWHQKHKQYIGYSLHCMHCLLCYSNYTIYWTCKRIGAIKWAAIAAIYFYDFANKTLSF